MSALPRPDLPAGPRRDLVEALHDLHHRAGWPSLRTLARQTGVSHTTVSKVFSTSALPTWGTVELLVAAMGGDTQQFHGLWLAASTPSDSTAPPTLRIAGRRAELATVRRHMEIGSGLLLVTGEAGIGKTTLVTTAARTAMSFVAVGRCLPLSTEAPLMPVIDVLSALQEVDAGTWVEEALANAPAHVASSVARLLPSLGGHQPESRRDEFAHQHLLASVAHLLSSLAAARPVALLVEDLHWSDLTTLDLLEHQLSRGGGPPVVATWREENSGTTPDQQGWLDRIQRLPTTEVVELGELSREDTFEQLRLMDGGTPDPDRAERVYARSLGHPLFTEHLARQRGQDLSVPRHLSEMLQHRFVGIGPSATAVAATLAVADRGLPSDVLTEAAGLDPASVVGALRELADSGLLLTGIDVAKLRHPLLAEAVRNRMVPGESAVWHGALAAALARRPVANPAEVAEHWRNAGDQRQEIRWRVVAARQAHDRTAPRSEAQQWMRAIELLPTVPDAGVDEVGARLAAFDACELSGNLAEGFDVIKGAMRFVDRLDNRRAAEVLRRMAMAEDWLSDDVALGLSIADRALALLAPYGASDSLVRTLDVRANHLLDLGRDDEALETLGRALDACEEMGDDALFLVASATLAWHQANHGDLDAALRTVAEARGRMDAFADPRSEAYMGMMHTDALLRHRRPPEEVMAAAAPAIAVGRAWDMDFHLLTITRANVVDALVKAGRVREASEELAGIPASDRYDHWPVAWMSGQIAIAQGKPDEGIATFRRLEIAGTTEENLVNRAHWIAVAQLWLRQPEEAWSGLLPAIEGIVDTVTVRDAGLSFALLARAAADLADERRDRAEALRSTLVQLRRRAAVDPLCPAPAPITRAAAEAEWEAQLHRIDLRDSVEQWVAAAGAWDILHAPHDAAYCRWRAALVALRGDQGSLATRLLRRAATDARQHVPLSEAIEATARRR